LGDIPYVNCNSGEINQVLLNLFINAIDAIQMNDPEATGTIKILTSVTDNFVCVEIEDDGIGISEEIQSKIFEPFFTTKHIGGGTGLGLSICYDIIVKKHQGEILMHSHPGIGSKFTIKLPI
ncbi:MAG TPA: ATP-binding protein, partial [Patescibacteria group bacterium]|nr:ATP-binding protein [Patescibacteria group bacterium]